MPSMVVGTSVVNGFTLPLLATVVNAGGAVDQSIEATPDAGSLAEILTLGLVLYQPFKPAVPPMMLAVVTGLTVSMRTVIVPCALLLPAASMAEYVMVVAPSAPTGTLTVSPFACCGVPWLTV